MINLNVYKELIVLNENQTYEAMKKILSKYYKKKNLILTHEYIAVKGDIPITLVSHMDTVFTYPPKQIFHDKELNVMWSPTGMGADDKAGLFIILNILALGYRPNIIVTMGEEKGGIGAYALADRYQKTPPFEMKYIIELDRRGSEDCVFYDDETEGFHEYVESFGFKKAIGSFSDVAVFTEEWSINGVNLSAGYYNEHTVAEYLDFNVVENTITKVENMLLDVDNFVQHPFKIAPNYYYNYNWDYEKYYAKSYGDAFGYTDAAAKIKVETKKDPAPIETFHCDNCGKDEDVNQLYSVDTYKTNSPYGDEILCEECHTYVAKTCIACSSKFTDVEGSKKKVCPKCSKDNLPFD